MFEGAKNITYNESIADFGARKTLGMTGSLVGYIQTGNSFDKRYYKPDSFYSKNKEKSEQIKKNSKLSKAITYAGIALTAFGAVFGILKAKKAGINFGEQIKKGVNFCKDKISNLDLGTKAKNLGSNIKSAASKAVNSIKNKGSKAGSKIKTTGLNISGKFKTALNSAGGFFKNLVSKFKK